MISGFPSVLKLKTTVYCNICFELQWGFIILLNILIYFNKIELQVLITLYWLGRKAYTDPLYNGPYLKLKAFEGLLGKTLYKVQYVCFTGDILNCFNTVDSCRNGD